VLDRAQQVADAVEPLSAEIGRHLGSVAKNQKLQNELGVHAATAPAGRRSPRNAHP
jgi:hypothetical protein